MKRAAHASQLRRLRGVAAVELAFTIMPLLMLAFGVVEYGRMIYTYNALDKAVRDAVRHLTAVDPADSLPQQEARNLAMYGSLSGSGNLLAPNLASGNIVICNSSLCPTDHANVTTGSGVINLVTVRISGYQYRSIVTYVAPATLNFNTISATMRSYQ
jgi:Flp pilus assembly protein TadG